MAVAAGFVLRAYAGLVAIDVEISEWLLLCTGLLALFLGFGKRRGEVVALGGSVHPQRPVLEQYSVALVDELIAVVTPSIIVAYSLYAVLGARSQAMLLTVPFVMYGVFRVLYLIHHGSRLPDDPTVVVWQDRPLQVCIVLWGLSAGLISALSYVRALVTGGTGFLGAHLANALAEAGYEVRTLDVNPPERPGAHEFVRADVRDAEAVRAAARGCERGGGQRGARAGHARQRGRVPLGERGGLPRHARRRRRGRRLRPAHLLERDLRRAARAAGHHATRRWRRSSRTGAARPRPSGWWRRGVRDGLTVGSLRPRTLLGEGRLGLFDVIFARIRAGKRVPLFGSGTNRVQMCDVDDFCAAALAAIERRANADYNIGSAGFGTVREDLEGLIARVGSRSRLQPVPVWAIRAVLQPLDARRPLPVQRVALALGARVVLLRHLEGPRRARLAAGAHERGRARERLRALRRARPGDAGASAHRRPLGGLLARLLRG